MTLNSTYKTSSKRLSIKEMITTLKVTNLNFDTASFAGNHLRIIIVINVNFHQQFFWWLDLKFVGD